MKKRVSIYITIIILLFCLSSILVIPELSITKNIIKFILIGILLYSTIYNIKKSKLFIKILFMIIFLITLIITYFLEPTNGFILYSGKSFITKSNNIYLYKSYAMIDGYLFVYEKDKFLPILHLRTSRDFFIIEDDEKVDLKKIDNKVYIQVNGKLVYLIEMSGDCWITK